MQLSRYGRPGEVREKSPKDIVTEVDLLCEEFLVSAIKERYPNDAILSEEEGGGFSDDGRTWLLDPLDGTANYSRANPLFCCCVSVAEGGQTTHTAVAAPRLGLLYHASLGGGAYGDSADGRTPLHVSSAGRLEDAFAGADSSFLKPGKKKIPQRSGMDRVLASCWQLRALGSAGVRGAWIAGGHLDVSVGATNTAWDYAPTALLVAEAGGRVTDLSGEPWSFRSSGMVATNGLLHDEALTLVNGG